MTLLYKDVNKAGWEAAHPPQRWSKWRSRQQLGQRLSELRGWIEEKLGYHHCEECYKLSRKHRVETWTYDDGSGYTNYWCVDECDN